MNAFGQKDYIDIIFPRNFMGVMSPPNLEEVLEVFNNDTYLLKDKECTWNESCLVKVDYIDTQAVNSIITPTIYKFLDHYSHFSLWKKTDLNILIDGIWRNTYKKGYHQEVHNHANHDLSCVIFLNEPTSDAAKFYFWDTSCAEITENWKKIHYTGDKRYVILPKGSFLFFPSNMAHGVSVHNKDDIRRTVSFNINFSL